jgi:hypothetical protein
MSVSSSKVVFDSPGTSTRKRGIWGPTHTYESDETSAPEQILQDSKLNQSANGGTHTTKTSDSSSEHGSPGAHQTTTNSRSGSPPSGGMTLERILESASAVVESIVKTASSSIRKSPAAAAMMASSPDATRTTTTETPSPRVSSAFELFVEEACTSPCAPRAVDDSPPRRRLSRNELDDDNDGVSQLGIVPMLSPAKSGTSTSPAQHNRFSDTSDRATPMGRRSMTSGGLLAPANTVNEVVELPMALLTFKEQESHDISRSISELTMRSSYGDVSGRMAESRRMAYYAVGKHHKNSGRGGNRRCYFTGKLILGGAPFYAGSVQQGLRTLVVFCLPSAIGLPKDGTDHLFRKQHSDLTKRSNASSQGVIPLPREYMLQGASALKHVTTRGSSRSTSISKTTSTDDMSFLEEELDPNWDLDRDYLLQVLPEPSNDLLDEMNVRYPDQFETLPVQVRSPHCWRLFVKFCFFSGLPIAEGELHYKVKDEIAMDVYGEEIILSHEVMEAVNGESAEILRLPNLKTFKYLRKHYTQQSGKLTDVVFQRTSWELVRPEI